MVYVSKRISDDFMVQVCLEIFIAYKFIMMKTSPEKVLLFHEKTEVQFPVGQT